MNFVSSQNLKMILSGAIVLVALLAPLSEATAQSKDNSCTPSSAEDTTTLQNLIRDQRHIIENLESNTMSIDLARLLFVKKSIADVENDIKNNTQSGKFPITFQTMRLIQTLIIRYRHSTVFFGWEKEPSINSIYTEESGPALYGLQNNYKKMVKVFGYDDSPYTTITANTFKEIKKNLDQVLQLPINENLKAKFKSLLPALGKTIAIAEQGDRPCAFAEAAKVNKTIRSLYPLFEELATSRAGYGLIMELQGANEFYAEYSQADQVIAIGQCK